MIDDGRGGRVLAGRAAIHANHLGAEGMSDLRDRTAHSAGNPEDRDGFTGGQLRRLDRPIPTDHEVDPDGGGFIEAEPFGLADQCVDRYRR